MSGAPRLFVTVDVEEWFDSTRLVARPKDPASDLPETTGFLLDAFATHGVKATFFFLQDSVERHAGLVERVLEAGHEAALHGESHTPLTSLSDGEFAAALERSRRLYAGRFGVTLEGFRAPYFSLDDAKLRVLKTAGFAYDSSVVPSLPLPGWYGSPRAPLTPYRIGGALDAVDPASGFWEFPMSVHPATRLPGLGGYYFRNLGATWTGHVLRSCLERLGYAMLYLHPWELSDRLPADAGIPWYMGRRCGAWTRENLDRLLAGARRVPGLVCPALGDYRRELAAAP